MSVRNKIKIAAGTGGLTASSIAAWFLLGGESSFSEEREEKHHQTRISRFKGIAQRVNSSLSKYDFILRDPEDGFWDKRFNTYLKGGWSDEEGKVVPEAARSSSTRMRDWCFDTIEENEKDVMEGSDLLSQLSGDIYDESKKFWDNCLESVSFRKQTT